MSNFLCEHCNAEILEGEGGRYVTGCEHYPIEGNMEELKSCPFCGGVGMKSFICGAAIPNCPKCSDIFGCVVCDVWMDTAKQWNTRTPDVQLREFAEDVALQYGIERNGKITTGGMSTVEWAFRILGWDDPHELQR
jgi:hypothetical protein